MKSVALVVSPFVVLAMVFAGCSDEQEGGDMTCPPGQVWQNGMCVPDRPDRGVQPTGEEPPTTQTPGDSDDTGSTTSGEPGESRTSDDSSSQSSDSSDTDETIQRCTGPGEVPTAITGTVTIPSGELPLPDVTVYIPDGELRDIETGALCVPCGDQLSGRPLAEATTDVNGDFVIPYPPEGEDITIVTEVGKWRRVSTIDRVEPCAVTEVDTEKTRLPRNSDEGHIPQVAITTGGWDALECLIRKIGVDDSEFSTDSGEGRIHLFSGRGGSDSFDASIDGGASFRSAWDWWNNLDNLSPYDIVMHSCEGQAHGGDKSNAAREALRDYTNQGGRVFLSHWQQVWLDGGPSDFASVADWRGARGRSNENMTGHIDTSFPKGQQLEEWMYNTGTTPRGDMSINQVRTSLRSIDESFATRWIWLQTEDVPGFLFVPGEDGQEAVQYFSFNAPLDAPEEDQCGRLVFSDIHVSASDNSSPSNPFPTGCTSSISDQEKALIFMFFDLSRCIVPDKI